MFEVGDCVRVINDGRTYSGYLDFFSRDEFCKYYSLFYESMNHIGGGRDNGKIGIVIASGMHGRGQLAGRMLFVVKLDDDIITLIDGLGLELVSKQEFEIDEFNLEELI